MKRIYFIFIFLFIYSALFSQKDSIITVHEWGTFTTLSASDGRQLNGLYPDEEKLPSFVYDLDITSTNAANAKGINTNNCALKNVTVKMETPVIYMYANEASDFTLKVGFTHGLISQWYPNRTAGTAHITDCNGGIDFTTKQSDIEWKGKVLAPTSTEKLTQVNTQSITWIQPRATKANLLKVGDSGEVEKYLFYRGLGNFENRLKIEFEVDGIFMFTNLTGTRIPYAIVYHKPMNGEAEIWWAGSLDKNARVTTVPNGIPGITPERVIRNFKSSLIGAGLYADEAEAMLKTWQQSYFETPGVKVFWIVPQEITDTLLPLEMKPLPLSVKRVMVGRSEILTPRFEDFIIDVYKHGSPTVFKGDRFELAYRERYEQLKTKGRMEDSTTIKYHVYPNTHTKTLHILAKTKAKLGNKIKIEAADSAGIILFTGEVTANATGHVYYEYNYSDKPAGNYKVAIVGEGWEPLVKPVVLE